LEETWRELQTHVRKLESYREEFKKVRSEKQLQRFKVNLGIFIALITLIVTIIGIFLTLSERHLLLFGLPKAGANEIISNGDSATSKAKEITSEMK